MLKTLRTVLFCLFGCFFCMTCGLDTIVVLAEPTVRNNDVYYDTTEPLSWYCDFITEEARNANLAEADFTGTQVYYKIYNNYSSLQSQVNAINSLNTSSNNTAAATRMIETYTYQPLATSPNMRNSVFVPKGGDNQAVRFRLKDVKNSVDLQYRAAIAFPYEGNRYTYHCYDETGNIVRYNYDADADTWTDADGKRVDYDSLHFVVPYRTVSGSERSFDFFDDNETDSLVNSEPVEGDIDYYYTSSGFSSDYEDTYFVQLFAVSVALDTNSCANTYSLVLDLGTIPIKKGQ